jgi:transcriptional regulator with XRE-family HTH domain
VPQSPSAVAARITRALAELRKERGITTEEVAERLGTAVQNVRRIEAGQNITLGTLVRFAQAIGVTVDVVFTPDPAGPRSVGRGRKW